MALERFEPADHGGQFHAIVGGRRIAAGELLLMLTRAQDGAPAARSRIARTGSVRENIDARHNPYPPVNPRDR